MDQALVSNDDILKERFGCSKTFGIAIYGFQWYVPFCDKVICTCITCIYVTMFSYKIFLSRLL